MAGRRPDYAAAGFELTLAAVARGATLVGAFVCAVTAPLAGATAAALFRDASPAAAATAAAALLSADLGTLSGAKLGFHLAATGLLVGCWLLGAGLLVEGLLE